MSKDLIAEADAAFHEFDAKMKAVMEELERHKSVIDDFEDVFRLRSVARDAGCAAVMEAAMALHEIRELAKGEVLDLMRPNHPRAVKVPRLLQ